MGNKILAVLCVESWVFQQTSFQHSEIKVTGDRFGVGMFNKVMLLGKMSNFWIYADIKGAMSLAFTLLFLSHFKVSLKEFFFPI